MKISTPCKFIPKYNTFHDKRMPCFKIVLAGVELDLWFRETLETYSLFPNTVNLCRFKESGS